VRQFLGQRALRSARAAARSARPVTVAERIESTQALDRPVGVLSGFAVRALPPGRRTDVLHGVPFGQPAHPALIRLPVGCWTSAVLLDLFGGRGAGRASATLITAGVIAAVPAAATTLFAGSLLARVAGRRGAGYLLSAGGLAAGAAGAYLGGHLALRLGAGASHAEPIGHLAALGWHDLCPLAELPEGRPVRRQLGYLGVLAVRHGDTVQALVDHCAHLGGPLHQGRVATVDGTACVTCPWHGSAFRLSDGAVLHGPATARQPAFDARVSASGQVQVRPHGPEASPWTAGGRHRIPRAAGLEG